MNKRDTRDIRPKNKDGRLHGYQEWYYKNKLQVRGNSKNGEDVGYQEFHVNLEETEYYIK